MRSKHQWLSAERSALFVAKDRHNGFGCVDPLGCGMSEDATTFRIEEGECRRQAGMTSNAASKAQWLLFAEEWQRLAQAAEAVSQQQTDNTVAAK